MKDPQFFLPQVKLAACFKGFLKRAVQAARFRFLAAGTGWSCGGIRATLRSRYAGTRARASGQRKPRSGALWIAPRVSAGTSVPVPDDAHREAVAFHRQAAADAAHCIVLRLRPPHAHAWG